MNPQLLQLAIRALENIHEINKQPFNQKLKIQLLVSQYQVLLNLPDDEVQEAYHTLKGN